MIPSLSPPPRLAPPAAPRLAFPSLHAHRDDEERRQIYTRENLQLTLWNCHACEVTDRPGGDQQFYTTPLLVSFDMKDALAIR